MNKNITNTTKIKPKGDQKGANRRNNCSQIMPWNVQRSSFFQLSFFLRNDKNGHGALVGLTVVKGTSVENSFNSQKSLENVVSDTCRSYVSKRYKCVDTGNEKRPKRE